MSSDEVAGSVIDEQMANAGPAGEDRPRGSFGAAAGEAVLQADIALARAGAIGAGLAALFTTGWLALLVIAPQPDSGAGPAETLEFIAAHDSWQIASFLVALPIALLMVPVWIALAACTWSRKPALALLSAAFGLLYAPFATWSYWSQLTVARGLARLYASDPEQAITGYRLFGFQDELWSSTYAADVAGYTILGVASLLIGVALLSQASSLPRACGALFIVTALLVLVWDTGFIFEYGGIEGAGAIGSGVAFLGAIMAAAILLARRGYARDIQRIVVPPAGTR